MTSEATLKQRPTNSHSHCTNTATTSALQPQQPNNNNDHSHRNSVMMVKLTPQVFRILGLLSVLCILLSVIGAPSIEDNMHDGLVLKSNERLSRSSGNSAMSKQMMMPESAPMMADSLEMDMAVGAEESVSFHGVPKAYNQHMEQALQELDSKTYVTERMLIKSGNIVAEVSNLSQSVEKVTNILQEYKEGFIEHQSQESNTRYHPYGTAQQQQAIRMTARVPSEHFETIIDTIQQAVGTQNVLEVHTNARDVTDQYVDAATRADVLQASRQALQTLLDKAHNVREVMEVQRELNRIVEQYESQKKRAESLKAQSSLSTLTVELRERVDPTIVRPNRRGFVPSRMVQRALEDISKVTSDMGNAAVYYTIVLVPLVLFGAVLFFAFGKTVRKYTSVGNNMPK